MSTFTTGRGTRAQHVAPRHQSAPYRMHPSRREHIYGRVQPMGGRPEVSPGALVLLLVVAVFLGFAIAVQL